MSIYTSIIVRQYAEGRISITTDRISGYLSNEGGTTTLWRKLLEWTSQKRAFETITIGVVNSSDIPYRSKLEQLAPISFRDITLNSITYGDLTEFDLIYFVGLPTSSSDLESVIESYVKNGGGIYIEVPDISGEIAILKGIESVFCTSVNRPLFGSSYWTENGKTHYAFTDPVSVGFLTSLDVLDFSSPWTALMTNEVSTDVIIPDPITTIETTGKDGSEFSIGYTVAMQKGIVEVDADLLTSSSSSFDSSSSSSSSSSSENDIPWDFCSNVAAYWKMDENVDSPTVWDESNNFEHMGILMEDATPAYTSDYHTTGVIGGALSFDGIQTRIETSSNTSLNFSGITDDLPFSVSFWIYPMDENGYIVCKEGVWEVYLVNYILTMTLHGSTGYRTFSLSSNPIPLNEWTNITMAYGGTYTGMYMYMNSDLKSHNKVQSSYSTMKDTDSPFYFAANNVSSFYEGYIDNMYIIDKQLSWIEVRGIWNLGVGTEECEGIYISPSEDDWPIGKGETGINFKVG